MVGWRLRLESSSVFVPFRISEAGKAKVSVERSSWVTVTETSPTISWKKERVRALSCTSAEKSKASVSTGMPSWE